MGLRINERGIALIKHFEGLRLEAYLCPAGIPTIGYGSTGRHVTMGDRITEAQAERLLRSDLKRFEAGVRMLIADTPTTSDQFSALVSFAFNLGLGNLQKSTLLKRHKRGDIAGASKEFGRWVYAAGRKLKGLERRRAAEARLYRGEM